MNENDNLSDSYLEGTEILNDLNSLNIKSNVPQNIYQINHNYQQDKYIENNSQFQYQNKFQQNVDFGQKQQPNQNNLQIHNNIEYQKQNFNTQNRQQFSQGDAQQNKIQMMHASLSNLRDSISVLGGQGSNSGSQNAKMVYISDNKQIQNKNQYQLFQSQSSYQKQENLDEKAIQLYNQYISVEVSDPIWSNDGKFRMYRIITKLKENPDFAIQVHRRYNDVIWLIQSLQVDNSACIIPPIPEKKIGSYYYKDDSEIINQRVYGIQRFLDYMIQHNILCANKDLEIFLTGQDHVFESRQKEKNHQINSDQLNLHLANVLIDGQNFLQKLNKDESYYKTTVQIAKQAGKGIQKISGAVAGAIMTGASYFTGSSNQEESKKQGSFDLLDVNGRIKDPTTSRLSFDKNEDSKLINSLTLEEQQFKRDLQQFSNEEVFIHKFIEKLQKLEQQNQIMINISEQQSQNYQKLSEKFGKLCHIQKLQEDDNIQAQFIQNPHSAQRLSLSSESSSSNKKQFEQLQKSSLCISKVLTGVQQIKKNESESLFKVIKTNLENMRLMLIAGIAAIERNKIILKFHFEKLKELKKAQMTAGINQEPEISHQQLIQQKMFEEARKGMGAVHDGYLNSNVEIKQLNDCSSTYTQRYIHDLKNQLEQLQIKVDDSRKILTIEMRKFKRQLVVDFNYVLKENVKIQYKQSQTSGEYWNGFLQQQQSIINYNE